MRGMGSRFVLIQVRHGTGARRVSLSDALGCDSRGVRALAYITICVDDSTGRNGGSCWGQTNMNANGGRRYSVFRGVPFR